MKKLFLFCLSLILLQACQSTSPQSEEENAPLSIVCTTGMLTDAVKEIVGNTAEVKGLMGPGVDPHLYKASQGDLNLLSNADIIVYNGLHLEGKMGEIFNKLKNRKTILIAAEAIPEDQLILSDDFQGAHDPHLWFDVDIWSQVVNHLGEQLGNVIAADSGLIKTNTQTYIQQLKELNQWVDAELQQLDSNERILITAHDAFGYFGRAYGIEVKGLQGISTLSEYGLKDVTELVNYITEKKINSVFIESSVSDRSLKAVIEGCKSKGHQVKIGGSLFSDALGDPNSPEGKYIGMVQYNIKTIVEGLK